MLDVTTTRRTMGVDPGDKYSYFCLIESGEVIEEGWIRINPEVFGKFLSSREPMTVAIEAGTHSPWANGTLSGLGHQVLVDGADFPGRFATSPSSSSRAECIGG